MRKLSLPVLSALVALVLCGCASANSDAQEANDPIEPVNRWVFDFNKAIDRNTALPAATFYRSAVPGGLRFGIHNFLSILFYRYRKYASSHLHHDDFTTPGQGGALHAGQAIA